MRGRASPTPPLWRPPPPTSTRQLVGITDMSSAAWVRAHRHAHPDADGTTHHGQYPKEEVLSPRSQRSPSGEPAWMAAHRRAHPDVIGTSHRHPEAPRPAPAPVRPPSPPTPPSPPRQVYTPPSSPPSQDEIIISSPSGLTVISYPAPTHSPLREGQALRSSGSLSPRR